MVSGEKDIQMWQYDTCEPRPTFVIVNTYSFFCTSVNNHGHMSQTYIRISVKNLQPIPDFWLNPIIVSRDLYAAYACTCFLQKGHGHRSQPQGLVLEDIRGTTRLKPERRQLNVQFAELVVPGFANGVDYAQHMLSRSISQVRIFCTVVQVLLSGCWELGTGNTPKNWHSVPGTRYVALCRSVQRSKCSYAHENWWVKSMMLLLHICVNPITCLQVQCAVFATQHCNRTSRKQKVEVARTYATIMHPSLFQKMPKNHYDGCCGE